MLRFIPLARGALEYGHLCQSGHWFGVTAAGAGIERQVALEAAVDATLLLVPPQSLEAIWSNSPEWARNILSLVLSNQLLTIRSAADLLIQDQRRRVGARLLTLSGLTLNQPAPKQPADVPLTQEQLAAMSGLSRNSVYRILSGFEAEGLCRRRYGSIHIPDLQALEKILDEKRSG